MAPWRLAITQLIEFNNYTVKSLLKDTPNKGHHKKYLSTKDTFGGTKTGYPMVVIRTSSPLKSGQPLYSGQISCSQCVLYTEVSLHNIISNS